MSWKDKKQRRNNSVLMVTLNIVLFPLTLCVMLLTASLAAPLLPLFTLPVFLIGFPRPYRTWPTEVGGSANTNADTVYYSQMAPQLAKALRDGYSFGSLGEPTPGSHYLVRFQDRLVWVMVLERGYTYCAVSIKGLELQETSCHTIEAGRIDDIFEVTFEKENGVPCCAMHPYPFDTLRPYDAASLKTYSDARNVLTGVIDSPESLQKVADGFVQCLTWILINYSFKLNRENAVKSEMQKLEKEKTLTDKSMQGVPNGRPPSVKVWRKLSTEGSTPNASDENIGKQQGGLGVGDAFEEWESQIDFGDEERGNKKAKKSRPGTADSGKFNRRAVRSPSLNSFTDSIWSSDSLTMETADQSKTHKVNLVSGFTSRHMTKGVPNTPGGPTMPSVEERKKSISSIPGLFDAPSGDELEPTKKKKSSKKKKKLATPSVADSLDDLSIFNDNFGLPATDIHQKAPGRLPPLSTKPMTAQSIHTDGFIDANALEAQLQYSSLYSRVLNPPMSWRQIPIESSKIQTYTEKFPIEWFKHVIKTLDLTVDGKKQVDVTEEILKDDVLTHVYAKIVMSMNAVVNSLGFSGVNVIEMGTSHVYKMYTGDVPFSLASSWIQDDPELLALVTKAYRYSVKLAIEQVLMGDVTSNDELQEYLEEYDRDWYIGSEKDPEWGRSVAAGKPTLFSFTHNPVDATYSSRTLTKQDVNVYIGSLNAEVVRGQWANLSLELLYMTNDDEERYSIQAHPTLLRNLTVQVADPPLGYPIYASPPISIPTL